jgi:hypothetical protein
MRFLVLMMLGACGGDPAPGGGSTTTPTTTTATTTTTPTPPTTITSVSGLPERTEGAVCGETPAVDPVCATLAEYCSDHDECPDGACLLEPYGQYCTCSEHACQSDDDCTEAGACACVDDPRFAHLGSNRCQPADCRSNADCSSSLCLADRGSCGPAEDGNDMVIVAWHCGTETDTCRNDEQCTGYDRCVWSTLPGADGPAFHCSENYIATCD